MRRPLCALAIGAVSAVVAQDEERDYTNKLDFVDWFSDNYTASPYGINPGDWALLMRQSIARGEYTFEGPDVSQPYPRRDSDSADDVDWAIRVDLATNISMEWAPNEDDHFDNSDYISGGVLSLSPTEDDWSDELEETFYPDPSWKICVYYPVLHSIWQEVKQKEARKKDDCGQIVPEECVSGFKSYLAELLTYHSDEDPEDSDGCPNVVHAPEPCPSLSDDYSYRWVVSLFRMEDAQPNRNGTYPLFGPWSFDNETRDEIDDSEYAPDSSEQPPYKNGSALFQWASLGGDTGNQTQLEEVGLVTPVFVAFGVNSTWIIENAEDEYEEGNVQAPHIEFFCAEATETTVDYLEEVPESNGVKTGVTGWIAGLMAIAVAMMMA